LAHHLVAFDLMSLHGVDLPHLKGTLSQLYGKSLNI